MITDLICFAIVPLALLGGALSWQNYIVEKGHVKTIQKELTRQASDDISFFFHEQEHRLFVLTRSNYLPDMSRDQKYKVFSTFLSAVRDEKHGYVFSAILLLDENGREIVRVSRVAVDKKNDLRDMSGSNEFIIPFKKGELYYSPVFFDESSGEPFVNLSLPVMDLRTQSVKEILVAKINLKFMWNLVAETRVGKSGVAYITDQNDRVFVHPDPSIVLKNTHFKAPVTPQIMKGVNGVKSVVATAKISLGANPIYFVTEIPVSESLKGITHSIIIIVVFLLLTMSGAVMLGFMIVRRIVMPIESLAQIATAISKGDLSRIAEINRCDELGALGAAFNSMTSQLMKSISELKKEKDFVRNTIESLSHPFYVIDAEDYTVKLANSAAQKGILGEASKRFTLWYQNSMPCGGPHHPRVIEEIKKTKQPVVLEYVQCDENNTSKTYEVYGYPIFDDKGNVVQIIEYNIDITQRRNLEEQLMQSQKLEALGILTGGVAHDFNNFLTIILGYGELLMINLAEDDPNLQRIEAIHAAGKHAEALVRQLLAFSRKQVTVAKPVNLNTLINNMTKMLGRLIGEDIEMKLLLRPQVGIVNADPGQIEQILMNLAVNARDAMPEGGKLFFETDTVLLDEEYCKNHVDVLPGSYVVLNVTDSGIGMSPEIMAKIFDPFFTTKKKGKGTGLGLSTVYGIMKQHKGHIFVYSEDGCGTTFKFYFPEEKVLEEEMIEGLVGKEKKPYQGGTETVLIVDDESSIRQLIRDTLQPLGYNVFDAESGKEAIEICKSTEKDIDLLVTDVVMPKMGGKKLADELTAKLPGMKVLYMSGYTDSVIAAKGIFEPGKEFINKPLVPSQLTQKIREILDKAI